MRDELTRLVIELKSWTLNRCIDLRFIDGEWHVMVSNGNAMQIVPETASDTALGAVNKALDRWLKRSESQPFL